MQSSRPTRAARQLRSNRRQIDDREQNNDEMLSID